MNGMLQPVLDHWPFIAFALMAATVTQVFKGTVWTAAHAKGRGAIAGFYWWGRKTLPLHPVLVGAVFGLIPGLPLSTGMTHTLATAALYYGAAGLASTWAFSIVKSMAKRRDVVLPTTWAEDDWSVRP